MRRKSNTRFEGPLTLFPAIDLRHGRCVRLYQGDPNQETHFSDDPVAVARRWASEGATWLHVVNLDGAFGEESENPRAVQKIVAAMREQGVAVQYGGGLRTLEDVREALGWGVARVVLGTVALREPELVRAAVEEHGPERIVVGIDARKGRVAVEGWQETTSVTALELAERMKEMGIARLVYTDIARDGTEAGPNIARSGQLAQESGLRVIVSGGVGSLDHVLQVRWIEPFGVEGVIVGRALYEGRFSLAEAIDILENSNDPQRLAPEE